MNDKIAFRTRDIICSPKNFELLTNKYPNRHIITSCYCPDNEAYLNGSKCLITIMLPEWSLWVSIRDEDGWPSRYIKKVK